ncbi:Uncharacterised protein [Mycobacteroides abscessus subsp. abscessus]|nr:Uncharacterised protein [Mycobacteroides abscessus subsp. abscessus]
MRTGSSTYPRASCTPPMYNSPATPAGTGRSNLSRMKTRLLPIGLPMVTPRLRDPDR